MAEKNAAKRGRPARDPNAPATPKKTATERVQVAAAKVHKAVDKQVANMAATLIKSGGSIDSPQVQNLVRASRDFLKALQSIATGETPSDTPTK